MKLKRLPHFRMRTKLKYLFEFQIELSPSLVRWLELIFT